MNIQKNWSPPYCSSEENLRPTLKEFQINGRWNFCKESASLRSESGQVHTIRAKTNEVLCLLIENVNKTVSVDTFLETVWAGRCPGDSVLRQSIFELRAIFKENDSGIIKTVPKQGYRLSAEIEQVDSPNPIVPDVELKPVDDSGEITFPNDLNLKKIVIASVISIVGFLACFLFYMIYTTHENANDIELSRYYFSSRSNDFAEDMFSLSNKHNEVDYLEVLIADYYDTLRSGALPSEEKFKKMISIIRIYLAMDKYQDAIVVVKSLIDWTSSQFGTSDTRWLIVNLYYLYINVEIGDMESASRTRKEIQTARQTIDGSNSLFEADYHYLQSLYYLACTYPFCDRPEAMRAGREHAEDAVRLYSDYYGEKSIQKADALQLLNWFTPGFPHDKAELLTQALEIYTQQLGSESENVADVLAELSRVQTVNRLDMSQGEANLLKALSIRQAIYPRGHKVIRKTYAYLGELYLAMNRKDEAIQNFFEAINNLNINERPSLETLLFLAKTYLYSGRINDAKATVRKALAVTEQYSETLPYFLDYELQAITFRVGLGDELMTESKLVSADLSSYSKGIAAKNGLPAAILSHELLTRLLEMNAGALNSDRYLNALDMILKNYRLNHRYLLTVDIDYLKNRSMRLCELKSQIFCNSIREKFSQYHVTI